MSDKIDYATIQDSATERVVGKDINGNQIYEITVVKPVNFTANSRIQLITISGVKRVMSVDGWVELPVSNSVLKWTTRICQEYINATLQKTAATWAYVNEQNELLVMGYGAAASTGNTIYARLRYTKVN